MKRKVITVLLSALMLFGSVVPTFATLDESKSEINNTVMSIEQNENLYEIYKEIVDNVREEYDFEVSMGAIEDFEPENLLSPQIFKEELIILAKEQKLLKEDMKDIQFNNNNVPAKQTRSVSNTVIKSVSVSNSAISTNVRVSASANTYYDSVYKCQAVSSYSLKSVVASSMGGSWRSNGTSTSYLSKYGFGVNINGNLSQYGINYNNLYGVAHFSLNGNGHLN